MATTAAVPAEHEPDRVPDWAAALVHSAVANRPVADVARLFALLDADGEHAWPSPASEVAAGRPLEELTVLLSALRGPQLTRGRDILRVAVVTRPVPEVVQLVHALGGPNSPVVEHALQLAAIARPVDDVVALARALEGVAVDRPTPPPVEPSPPPEEPATPEKRRKSRWSS
ncbi:hypothetical protein DN069_38915 [Streptacidiphilus pinicola]|uniref:Uncharacterized protein n=1 Tax=Streptacidiphilus pinicola TaxID=2219663 RepID=A0A2X0IZ90_9ACTN|nr:hypothetical protein [Streptacidiphilus pinicola]RAG80288.1 hypothetical protein DN069_38915 [Streptacidiphilus pinicola]